MTINRYVPYFIYGQEMVGLIRHRNISPNILEGRGRLGVAQSANLFIDHNGFPVLGIGKNPESFIFGEIFYINYKGIKTLKKIYAKEFPSCQLMKIETRIVEVSREGLRHADAIEKKVRVYGLPYEEAILNVRQGKLRYSIHNWYRTEISDPSPGNRENYPEKNYVKVDLIEDENETGDY